MRIATWNVNSLKIRLPRVEEWLAYAQPDVLCMQETKLADSAFPALAFSALGYESAHYGQGQWNGVRVASVYVPNGRSVGSEHYAAKLEWLDGLQRHVVSPHDPAEPLIICG